MGQRLSDIAPYHGRKQYAVPRNLNSNVETISELLASSKSTLHSKMNHLFGGAGERGAILGGLPPGDGVVEGGVGGVATILRDILRLINLYCVHQIIDEMTQWLRYLLILALFSADIKSI